MVCCLWWWLWWWFRWCGKCRCRLCDGARGWAWVSVLAITRGWSIHIVETSAQGVDRLLDVGTLQLLLDMAVAAAAIFSKDASASAVE